MDLFSSDTARSHHGITLRTLTIGFLGVGSTTRVTFLDLSRTIEILEIREGETQNTELPVELLESTNQGGKKSLDPKRVDPDHVSGPGTPNRQGMNRRALRTNRGVPGLDHVPTLLVFTLHVNKKIHSLSLPSLVILH